MTTKRLRTKNKKKKKKKKQNHKIAEATQDGYDQLAKIST